MEKYKKRWRSALIASAVLLLVTLVSILQRRERNVLSQVPRCVSLILNRVSWGTGNTGSLPYALNYGLQLYKRPEDCPVPQVQGSFQVPLRQVLRCPLQFWQLGWHPEGWVRPLAFFLASQHSFPHCFMPVYFSSSFPGADL